MSVYHDRLHDLWWQWGQPSKLRVLVGCEYSDTVASEFRKLGHFAVTCDLLETESNYGQRYHIQDDVLGVVTCGFTWDIVILHPPCTALCVSGNRWYGQGQPRHKERIEAIHWTTQLWHEAAQRCDHVALENPVGVLNKYGGIIPRPKYVQPWMFGDMQQKKTGLWLHGLPPLMETDNVYGAMMELPVAERQAIWYASPSEDRGKERSRTFPGMATAMADQWSRFVMTCKQENIE